MSTPKPTTFSLAVTEAGLTHAALEAAKAAAARWVEGDTRDTWAPIPEAPTDADHDTPELPKDPTDVPHDGRPSWD